MKTHSNKRVIAFAGPAGVGKSTAAAFLRSEARLGRVKILSFAEPMRRMVATLLPLDMAAFTQENKNNPAHGLCGKTPRRLLETIGTEWGKGMIGENIWLDIVADQISSTSFDTYAIDDLRTDAEAIYLKENFDATIIHLSRPGIEYKLDHITSSPISDSLVTHYVSTEGIDGLWVLRQLVRPII